MSYFYTWKKYGIAIWIGRSKALWDYKEYFPDFTELSEALNSLLKMSKYAVNPGLCLFIYVPLLPFNHFLVLLTVNWMTVFSTSFTSFSRAELYFSWWACSSYFSSLIKLCSSWKQANHKWTGMCLQGDWT